MAAPPTTPPESPDRDRSRRGLGFPSQSGAMVGCSRGSLPTWMTAAAARVDLSGGVTPSHQGSSSPSPSSSGPAPSAGADQELGMFERALSAAGAAFVSAIIVNPLDVAKVGSPGALTPSLTQVSPPGERVFVCVLFGV